MDYNPTNLPPQITENYINATVQKTKTPFVKLVLLAIFAGMFIAAGGSASSVAMHSIKDVGLARLVAGCIFPVGLMLIVFIGGELFTGDCMMIMGCLHKKISVFQMLRVLFIVYMANLVGAVVFAYLVFSSGQFGYTGNLLGAFTIKVAVGKVNLSFFTAFCSGILCNIFVCAAVLTGSASKDIGGKVWAIFFPIMAFVVSGYEHCVANMYYIPAGIFCLSKPEYVDKAIEAYGYTQDKLDSLNWANFLIKSAIPVTLGNMVGGMLFIGAILYFINKDKIAK